MIHFDIKEPCDALLEKIYPEKKTQLIILLSFINYTKFSSIQYIQLNYV